MLKVSGVMRKYWFHIALLILVTLPIVLLLCLDYYNMEGYNWAFNNETGNFESWHNTFFNDNFVFVVVDNKVKLTKVELGNRRPGEVEIVAGLSPGDVVVTEGQIKLRDGAPVMVMGAPPAPESKTAKDGSSKAG